MDTETKKAWEAFRPTDVGIFIVIGVLSVFVFDHQKNIDNNKIEIEKNFHSIDDHMTSARPRVLAEIEKVKKLTRQVSMIASELHLDIRQNQKDIKKNEKELVINKISEMEARFELEKKLESGRPAKKKIKQKK